MQTEFWTHPAVAYLAGFLTALLATYANHCWTKQREREKEAKTLNAERAYLASAIANELEGLFDRYMKTIGVRLENAKTAEGFKGITSPGFNYFVTYDSNTNELGMLKEEDALAVSKFYIQSKGHLDNLRIWSAFCYRPEYQAGLEEFFEHMKRDHSELTSSVKQVILTLRSYITH